MPADCGSRTPHPSWLDLHRGSSSAPAGTRSPGPLVATSRPCHRVRQGGHGPTGRRCHPGVRVVPTPTAATGCPHVDSPPHSPAGLPSDTGARVPRAPPPTGPHRAVARLSPPRRLPACPTATRRSSPDGAARSGGVGTQVRAWVAPRPTVVVGRSCVPPVHDVRPDGVLVEAASGGVTSRPASRSCTACRPGPEWSDTTSRGTPAVASEHARARPATASGEPTAGVSKSDLTARSRRAGADSGPV